MMKTVITRGHTVDMVMVVKKKSDVDFLGLSVRDRKSYIAGYVIWRCLQLK